MKKFVPHLKSFIPHFIALGIFIAISTIYCSPAIQGKVLDMTDIKNHEGMKQELVQHRLDYNEEALWTNRMFSGMPAYQMGTKYPSNVVLKYIDQILQLGLPRPINMIFMYLIGFYILLLTLKIDFRVAILGSIAFAFSSYFFIILEAGHMTKAHAIAYIPLVVASVLYTYRGKVLLGSVLASLTLALQLYSNHPQITYYTAFILFFIAIVQFFKDLKEKRVIDFLKRSSFLLFAFVIAFGANFSRIWTTTEYGKDSIRGKSELTLDLDNKTSGVDKDYATDWSYGVSETMTLMLPNFFGGSSQGSVGKNTETGKILKDSRIDENRDGKISNKEVKLNRDQVPLYWGDQPFTSGPTYAGAIVVFLFVMGLFLLKNRTRNWIILATIMSITLAWGKNFMFLTELFLDYFPAYNKFRAVSMILVIAEFTLPFFAFIALSRFLTKKEESVKQDNKLKTDSLKKSFYIVGGITLFCALILPSILSFIGPNDGKDSFYKAVQEDRKSFFVNDALRSMVFISLTFGVLWFFIKNKIKSNVVILILGVLIVADLWTVNKRYLNDSNFINIDERSFIKNNANKDIDDDYNLTKKQFRVYNLSVNTFADASTSYFHNSIGGYHGAKLGRYEELYKKYIIPSEKKIDKTGKEQEYSAPSPNKGKILSMLNTQWIIHPYSDESKKQRIVATKLDSSYFAINSDKIINNQNQLRLSAKGKIEKKEVNKKIRTAITKKYILIGDNTPKKPLGNAWFVSSVQDVENADQEIESLSNHDLSITAIVDKRFDIHLKEFTYNPESEIVLQAYKPNHLTYHLTNIDSNQLAVFSEIYYEKGWNAYIDGKVVPHFRANYILRAMMVPAGTIKIEFKFEPSSYSTGETVAYASSILLLLLLGFVSYKELK